MKRWLGLLMLAGAALAIGADDKKEDSTKDELKKLEGTWVMVSGESDGVKAPADAIKGMKIIIKDSTLTKLRGDDVIAEGPFTINPTKKPKTIDIFTKGDNKAKGLGIYELDGDTLKIYLKNDGKDRPTEFGATKGSGCTVGVYKREKK